MPQFDIVSFFVQIFYAFLFMIAFYLFTLKFFLVRIAEVMKIRRVINQYNVTTADARKKVKNASTVLHNAVIQYWNIK